MFPRGYSCRKHDECERWDSMMCLTALIVLINTRFEESFSSATGN